MDWVDRLRQAVDAKGKHSAVAMDAGVNPSALSDILRRKADPQLQTVINLCRVCGVTVGWVLGEAGFELGDDDYAHLGTISRWAKKKLDERNERTGGAPIPWVKRKRPRKNATTEDDAEELLDRAIPAEYAQKGADAVFLMRGDAMIEAWIIEGDVLFVQKTARHADAHGKLAVCRLDGALTVKRVQADAGMITLSAPVLTMPEDTERYEQIGIVVGMARDLA